MNSKVQSAKINEPRLGMVMKENASKHPGERTAMTFMINIGKAFKNEVIKTYQLFTEIAQELEQRVRWRPDQNGTTS